jgi:hypothetical protein
MLSQPNIDFSQTIFSDLTNLELDDSSPKNPQDDQYNNNDNGYNNDPDGLLYGLSEVQEIISKQFQNAEDLNEPVKLAFEIELNSRLVEDIFPEFQLDTCDLETIKRNFRQLANILLLPFEYGSGYYWEVRKVHLILISNNNVFLFKVITSKHMNIHNTEKLCFQ